MPVLTAALLCRRLPRRRQYAFAVLLLVCASPAFAHVGTGSVFVQGNAGPYPVYISVTPPTVIPGEATVSVLCDAPGIQTVSVQANVLSGAGTQAMPQPWLLEPGPAGSHEFRGTAWIMTEGSWQVRVQVAGTRGAGALSVPLPASPLRLLPMSKPFGAWLLIAGLTLLAGLGALAFAAAREAGAAPGTLPTPADARRGRRAALVAFAVMAVLLFGAFRLWRGQVTRYRGLIYKPLSLQTALAVDGVLHLHITIPPEPTDAISNRHLDDLILDHNHLMHAYLVRWPAMDEVFHLHPEQQSPGNFALPLPAVPAGEYRLFTDIVHADGFPETAVGELHLDRPQGRALSGDDAYGQLPAVTQAALAASPIVLPDGYRMEFAEFSPSGTTALGAGGLRANAPVVLRFTLLNPAGHPPADMQNYMGMLGHLAVIRTDGSVFAHIHPEGSASMAAYMLANRSAVPAGNDMGSMAMSPAAAGPLPNTAAFPFGFPAAGTYRLIIQMKHGNTVETGATDVQVQ